MFNYHNGLTSVRAFPEVTACIKLTSCCYPCLTQDRSTANRVVYLASSIGTAMTGTALGAYFLTSNVNVLKMATVFGSLTGTVAAVALGYGLYSYIKGEQGTLKDMALGVGEGLFRGATFPVGLCCGALECCHSSRCTPTSQGRIHPDHASIYAVQTSPRSSLPSVSQSTTIPIE